MKDLGRIRRLFYRDGVSLSEISRKTGYSRNTVKRWLKTPEGICCDRGQRSDRANGDAQQCVGTGCGSHQLVPGKSCS